jgi:hypothetical protein
VAADDVRKIFLLVEVLLVLRGRRLFLGGGVGPDVPVGGVAVVGAVVPDPWEYIPCSCLHRLLRPVRLPCFPVSGSKLLALVVDTGEAYPPAPSEAVLWIPFSGAATML